MTWNWILFVNRNPSVFRLINIILCHMSAKQYQSLSMLINVFFVFMKMQRFIFLVHLIEHKIFGQPTTVFVILVTNIIEKGPFICICEWVYLSAIHGFSYYFLPCMTNITKSQFWGLKESREGGRDAIPINYLALDSFDNDILTRYVTSKWLAFNFGLFYTLKKKKHFNIPLDIINAVKISLLNFISKELNDEKLIRSFLPALFERGNFLYV